MTTNRSRRLALLLAVPTALALLAVLLLTLGPPAAPPLRLEAAPSAPEEGVFRLDLNTASAGELEGLPGIGPVLAQRLLDRRAELGAFRTREDVLSVPGIGEATYEAIAPYITLDEKGGDPP